MKVKTTGNISQYEQKSVGIFTLRQILYSAAGIAVGIWIYTLIDGVLPVIFSTLVAALIGVAIAACGFVKLGGMPLSKVFGRIIRLMIGKGKYKYVMEDNNVWEEKGRTRNKSEE